MIFNKNQLYINIFRFFIDIFIFFLSWIGIFILRFNSGLFPAPKGHGEISMYLSLSVLLIFVYTFVFLSSGIYKRTLQQRKIWTEHFDIIKYSSLAFFIFITLAYFLFDHRYSRVMLGIYLVLSPIFIMFGRSIIRKISRKLLKYFTKKHKVIIIGANKIANRVEDILYKHKDWNIEIINKIDLTNINLVKELKNTVETIFIAINIKDEEYLNKIYDDIGDTIANIIIVPDFGFSTFLSPKTIFFDELPAISLNVSNLDYKGLIIKRIFDVCFSIIFIIIFFPLYLICGLLVKLSSKGPILYQQERMGLDGKIFKCLKFRGMYNNAESKTGPIWATSQDTRTTKIGAILRKTSLDEIPQFFNVLKGEMSIVGPRPERPVFVNEFRMKIPGYMLRHKSKAGITGWAQINGWRGNTSLEKRIECDLWYLQNWSIWLDIKICLLTPIKGLVNKNAY